MKLKKIVEGKNSPGKKAVKIWLKISDLFTDLEDELRDIPDNPVAQQAIAQLRQNDLQGLHQSIRQLFN
jgi:hypothetical protein